MKHEAKELGLKPKKYFLVSAAKGHSIKEAAAAIDEYREW